MRTAAKFLFRFIIVITLHCESSEWTELYMDPSLPACSFIPYLIEFFPSCNQDDSNKMNNVYFHAIFDFQKPSSFPLVLLQLCHAEQQCFHPANYRIVLHQPADEPSYSDSSITSDKIHQYLQQRDIQHIVWTDEFNTISSQSIRFKSLQHIQHPYQLIYQVDNDELPYFENRQAFFYYIDILLTPIASPTSSSTRLSGVLESSAFRSNLHSSNHDNFNTNIPNIYEYDVVYGKLYDRLPLNGELLNISSTSSLSHQFPLYCHIKRGIETGVDRKLILYRGNYRPSVGNHQLICEGKSTLEECSTLFLHSTVIQQFTHPVINHLPIPIPQRLYIPVDHYKYTWGVGNYLIQRVGAFKKAKIPWVKQSEKVLDYLKKYDNKICVDCPISYCSKTAT